MSGPLHENHLKLAIAVVESNLYSVNSLKSISRLARSHFQNLVNFSLTAFSHFIVITFQIDLVPMSLKKLSFHVAKPSHIRRFRKDSMFDIFVQILGIHFPLWLSVIAVYITLVEILSMKFCKFPLPSEEEIQE